jgi:GrpB-like predicted nucleotidyltransferase (UPF0157 family)
VVQIDVVAYHQDWPGASRTPRWYEHTFHPHLTEPGSDVGRERLAFRDALRGDTGLRDEYQALKRRLAQAHRADVATYTAAKRGLVARVLARGRATIAPWHRQP